MKSSIRTTISALLFLLTPMTYADNMQLDINYLLTRFDAGSSDDFSSGKAIALHFSYDIRHWLVADVGMLLTDKALDETGEDAVGQYRAALQTQAIMLGVKPRYRSDAPYEAYARLGLQYWRTELEVDEYFSDTIPGGTTTANDDGFGYYVSIGGAHYITDSIIIQLELRHFKQLDLFADSSNYPFDLAINAISIGAGYRF